MIGPGKYDDACTSAREQTGGSVLLVVLGGNFGDGFSCQTTLPVHAALPSLLRQIAAEIERDVEALKNSLGGIP